MKSSTAKKLLWLALLLLRLAHGVQSMPGCCLYRACPCPPGVPPCCAGASYEGTTLSILTLAKRKIGERRLQSRLLQLLHGSRDQAAGILTVGRRAEASAARPARATLLLTPCASDPGAGTFWTASKTSLKVLQ
ncbi:hypothetical protein MATL_G00213360 [Megalops atlanticus]|uniref:Hypocretin neuropeptide precursor n=1 Tax=Megalops atlanticus TaxID=7932 RepID=A0A9D3PI04_MEGAT|nr:hypothetical protein MATL_G00213360 [Megalops atlanticus]